MGNDSKLRNVIDKKFRTTYIGAIYAIEKAFGIKWDKSIQDYVIDPERDQPENQELNDSLLDLLGDIRDEILDIGNAQCRNLKSELDEYFEIKPRIFSTNFRIAIEE